MRFFLLKIFSLLCLSLSSQQTIVYTQYIFNKAGINPAAAGININQKINYTAGANRQWVDIDNAPKATFANFSYTIRPPRSYSYWQNIGCYFERDQSGIISNNNVYANYTIHLLLRKNLVASFGVYAGIREFFLTPGLIDPNDPVNKKQTARTLVYPDVIPGVRLSNKKFFLDVAARQISATHQQDYKGRKIGGPSYLNPSLFLAYGQVFGINDHMVMLPSLAVNMPIVSAPVISPTVMFYYSNRFGFGAASRNLSFVSAIFQVRMLENLTAGFSYSYSINRMNVIAPNTYEIMIGVVPMGLGGKFIGGNSVAKCPTLDF